MDGSQVVTEALSEMSAGFFALVSGLVLVIGLIYTAKAIWIIFRRRS